LGQAALSGKSYQDYPSLKASLVAKYLGVDPSVKSYNLVKLLKPDVNSSGLMLILLWAVLGQACSSPLLAKYYGSAVHSQQSFMTHKLWQFPRL